MIPRTLFSPEHETFRDSVRRFMQQEVVPHDERWQEHLGLVEYAVEDAPQIPDDWDTDRVPLASLVRGSGSTPTRLVVFRRPIEHRSPTRADLELLVVTVVVEQLAELLGIEPSQVDPRYPDPDD